MTAIKKIFDFINNDCEKTTFLERILLSFKPMKCETTEKGVIIKYKKTFGKVYLYQVYF